MGLAHAISNDFYVCTSNNKLYKVDVGTGQSTLIGEFHFDNGTPLSMNNHMTDIAFSPTGELYGVTQGEMYRVNTSNASIEMVADFTMSFVNSFEFNDDPQNPVVYLASGLGYMYTFDIDLNQGYLMGFFNQDPAGDLAISPEEDLFISFRGYYNSNPNQYYTALVNTGYTALSPNIGAPTDYKLYGMDFIQGKLYSVTYGDTAGGDFVYIDTSLTSSTAGDIHYVFTPDPAIKYASGASYHPYPVIDPLSVEDRKVEFKLYPNPATDYIVLNVSEAKAYRAEIMATDGRILRAFENLKPTSGEYRLDLGGIPNGTYILRLIQGRRVGTLNLQIIR